MPLKKGLAEVLQRLRVEATPNEVGEAAAMLAARPDLWFALTREERAKLARTPGDLVRKIVHVIQASFDQRPRGHRNHPCAACGRETVFPAERAASADDVRWLERCDSCGHEETRAY